MLHDRVLKLAVVTVLIAVGPAWGEFRYDYLGNNFTGEAGDAFTLDDFITGYVDFDSRPVQGSTPTVLAFSLTAGPLTIDNSSTGVQIEHMDFEFSPAGGITGWEVSVWIFDEDYPDGIKSQLWTLWRPPSMADPDGQGSDVAFLANSPFPPDSSIANNFDAPGQWSPVPEPSTLTLWSLCGLLGLWCWRRRRGSGK